MGSYTLEHLVLCLRLAQLHGWLHHMGMCTIACRRFVRETRLLIFSACPHHRHFASRLLDCAQAIVRRRRYVRSKRPLSLQPVRHELASCSSVVRRLDPAHARFCQRSRFLAAHGKCCEISMSADPLQVNPSLNISTGARHLASLGYMYGLLMSAGVYVLLSRVAVAKKTIVKSEHGSV